MSDISPSGAHHAGESLNLSFAQFKLSILALVLFGQILRLQQNTIRIGAGLPDALFSSFSPDHHPDQFTSGKFLGEAGSDEFSAPHDPHQTGYLANFAYLIPTIN